MHCIGVILSNARATGMCSGGVKTPSLSKYILDNNTLLYVLKLVHF